MCTVIQIICHSGDIDWCKYYKWSKIANEKSIWQEFLVEIWWGEQDTLPPQPLLAHCVLAHSWHIKLPRTAKEVMEGWYWRIKPPFTLFTKLPKYLFSVKMIEKCKITSSFMRNYFVKLRSNEKVMHGSCKIVLNLSMCHHLHQGWFCHFAPRMFISFEPYPYRYYNPTYISRYI